MKKNHTIGGVDKFWLIPQGGMKMSNVIDKVINRIVISGVFTIYCTRDSIHFQEGRQSKSHIRTDKSLTCFHPGDSEETKDILSRLSAYKYYVLLENRVQEKYLMSLHPCSLKYEYVRGQSLDDESGYRITLETTQPDILHRVNYLSFQRYIIDSNLQALTDNTNRLITWKMS